jgi:pyruvate,water dikinase
MEKARIEEGDILVNLFINLIWSRYLCRLKVKYGIGGVMTHGAVIAREYGLPTVVGVENATKRIKDGRKIRLTVRQLYSKCDDATNNQITSF